MQIQAGAVAWSVLSVGAIGALVWLRVASWSARSRAAGRLYRTEEKKNRPVVIDDRDSELFDSLLERWLAIAGYRSPRAVAGFLLAQGIALVIGVIVTLLVANSTALETGRVWLLELPGGVGDFLAPVLSMAPWILFLTIGFAPILVVRSKRREIVEAVERDLPITLSLLATLVESGLGFDAATTRVLTSLSSERPLARELQLFRSEIRAGMSRLSCFRRMAERLDTTSVSTFVSAMIHAEQVGGGIAESLRHQADEVWNRRRQYALQKAQTLPTKMAVPLVVCFLPGIFVYTFGPALAQFLEIAEGAITGRS